MQVFHKLEEVPASLNLRLATAEGRPATAAERRQGENERRQLSFHVADIVSAVAPMTGDAASMATISVNV